MKTEPIQESIPAIDEMFLAEVYDAVANPRPVRRGSTPPELRAERRKLLRRERRQAPCARVLEKERRKQKSENRKLKREMWLHRELEKRKLIEELMLCPLTDDEVVYLTALYTASDQAIHKALTFWPVKERQALTSIPFVGGWPKL